MFQFFRYFEYEGSLTTPPCTENVKWVAIAHTCFVPNSFLSFVNQYDSMKNNYRPVQSLNEREIQGYTIIPENVNTDGQSNIIFL